jgi:DNA-binding PadR family transcriptional regulator
MIKNFMDIIILKHLKDSPVISGYEVIGYLHKKFDILLSPGTVYQALSSLEREGLIKANVDRGRREYKLTNKGERFLNHICSKKSRVQEVFSSIFSEV